MSGRKITMEVKYNGHPRKITVACLGDNEWGGLDKVLRAVGFRRARGAGWEPIPGRLVFLTGSAAEQEAVVLIARSAGMYLSCGNFEESSSI